MKTELIFAGTGNAFNYDGYANQAVLIKTDKTALCIDAGPTLLYRLKKEDIDPGMITHLLITHFHGDHTAGIPFLLLYFDEFLPGQKLTICGPKGIKSCVRGLIEAAYKGSPLDKMVEYREYPVSKTNNIHLTEKITFDIYPMDHSPESLGYRFKTADKIIAITGDTKWNSNIPFLFDQADIGIIECTTVEPSPHKHISFEEFKTHRHQLNCQTIIPVHVYNKTLAKLKELKEPRIRLVQDGERFSV